jgi:hypothetical protein
MMKGRGLGRSADVGRWEDYGSVTGWNQADPRSQRDRGYLATREPEQESKRSTTRDEDDYER